MLQRYCGYDPLFNKSFLELQLSFHCDAKFVKKGAGAPFSKVPITFRAPKSNIQIEIKIVRARVGLASNSKYRKMPKISPVACVAGVKGGRERGNSGARLVP